MVWVRENKMGAHLRGGSINRKNTVYWIPKSRHAHIYSMHYRMYKRYGYAR